MTRIIKEFGKFNLIIEFDYSPGSPGTMYQKNGDPGDPPEPEELDITACKLEVLDDASRTGGCKFIDLYECGFLDEFDLGEKIEQFIMDAMPDESDGPDEPEFYGNGPWQNDEIRG